MKRKLNELTICEAKKGLKKGKFTVTELVKACLKKIKERNKIINAFLTVCEKEALLEAKEKDKLLKKNSVTAFKKYPLLGMPIAIKDNFCTTGIKTTAASKVLENFFPPYDATVVKKLKEAGAIIIGKTNMDAWAHGSSTETSDWGTTKNPYNLNYSPGGSSGGSAAAVADNMCLAAIGSETSGSIRQPAAWCGTVGLKPTYGRISRFGLIAMCSSTDCPGPITKTVEDAALILTILAGKDENDATSIDKPMKINFKTPFKKLVIGVPKEYFPKEMDKEVKKAILRTIEFLKKDGYQIKEISLLDPKYSLAVYTIIQRAEVSSNLARFDGIRYGNSRHLFGKEAKRRIMLGTFVLSSGYYDQYYVKGLKARKLIENDFEKIFKKIDLIIAPTSPSTALPIGESEKSCIFGEKQDILVESSSLAGLPAINLNCGFSKKGLPIGLQIIGNLFQEEKVLKMAKAIESLINNNYHLPFD